MAISPVALSALLQTTALQPIARSTFRPVDLLLQEVVGTRVSLSSFGRMQSVVAGLADAAAGLRGDTAARDPATLRGALERFVAAVNTAGLVSDDALFARFLGGLGSLVIDDSAALRGIGELLRGVNDPRRNGGVELAALGITRQPDGRLLLDAASFNDALAADSDGVTAAMRNLGETVLAAATAELGAGGRLNAASVTFDFLLASLRLQQLGGAFIGAEPAVDITNTLLLASNPFLFRGVDAFRLIADL